MLQGSRGLFRIDGRRQAEAALERANPEFLARVVLLGHLVLVTGFALDGEHFVVDGNLDVLGIDARNRGADNVFRVGLVDIETKIDRPEFLDRAARSPFAR